MLALTALFLGGVALIIFERWHLKRSKSEPRALSYPEALLVGLAQSVAVIPGISRSAATIVGGLMLGINRQTIVEFSFLLAVPTMLAATGLDLLQTASAFSRSDFGILAIGFVSSFVVAIVSIRWLLSFIKTHDFTSFGIYRILAAALFALLLFS
jgi:undecaprenyl-diphosphatase